MKREGKITQGMKTKNVYDVAEMSRMKRKGKITQGMKTKKCIQCS